jgi:predicted small metal-binding protein
VIEMTKQIYCKELGLVDCDFQARGETPGEVITDAVEHLEKDHEMELPDAEVILEGDYDPGNLPEKTRLVVQRLRRAANIHSEAKMPHMKPIRNVPPTDQLNAGTK